MEINILNKSQALPEHGVTTVFVELANTKLELLHPLGEGSPIQVASVPASSLTDPPQGFLDKNTAGGIHHICIEVSR